MAEPSNEITIAILLEDLKKYEARWRSDAIKKIIKDKINDPRVIDALLQVVKNDHDREIRNYARRALDTFGVEHSEVEKDGSYAFTVKELSGFFGWYIANGIVWYALTGGSDDPLNFIYGMFTFPVNLIIYGVLRSSKSTREISNGMLAAVIVNFVLGLLAGMFMNGICFIPFYIR